MKTSAKAYPFLWLMSILFCLTIFSSCQSPEEKAKVQLEKEAKEKKAQEEQVKKKALDELESQS